MRIIKRFDVLAGLVIVGALTIGFLPAVGAQAQTASASATPAPTAASTALATNATCSLTAADCTLLAEANANLAKETSFTQTIDFTLKLSEKTPVDVSATGSGPFMFDASSIPLGFRTQVDLKTVDNTTSKNGTWSLAIVGEKLYFKRATDWQGVNLTNVLKVGQTASAATPVPGVGDVLQDPKLSQAIAAITTEPGVITVTRNPTDATLDNQTMAQFVYTVDVQKLLQSPNSVTPFADLFKAALTAVGKPNLANKLNDRLVKGALALLSRALSKTTLTITRWVGVDDHLFHAIDVEMGIAARLNPLPTAKPLTGSLHLLITLSAIGSPVTITEPQVTTLIDPSQFASGLVSGSGLLQGPIGGLLGGSGPLGALQGLLSK